MLNNLIRSTTERIKASNEDFSSQAARVMKNRRIHAAENLIKDFSKFVEQNEWGHICTGINNVNCAH